MNWQSKFSDTVSTVAFHLTLSKRMVYTLELVAINNIHKCHDEGFNHLVPAIRSLIERGLVQRHELPESYAKMDMCEKSHVYARHRFYTLTPAGEHVVELLKLAGILRPVVAVAA